MPLEFTCPHCQARTVVDEEYLGLAGPCFQCGKTVAVPLRPSTSASDDARRRARERRAWRVSLLVLFTGLLFVGGTLILAGSLLQPIVQSAIDWSHRSECTGNLQRIARALQLYHDRHGRYPPAYLTDAQGKPTHSWRVLILRELGEETLYQQYNLNEPWDGPGNSLLQTRMPAVYGCRSDPNYISRTDSSYLAVVGKQTAFDTQAGRSLHEFRDGPQNTLLVVEVHESGINWLDPRDLPFNALGQGVNGPAKLTLRSSHPNGAHVATADGKVHFLDDATSVATLEALATVDGGEVVELPKAPGAFGR
jgi:predicted Zn finger-like uncharacterized protein